MFIYFAFLLPPLVLAWGRPSPYRNMSPGLVVYFIVLLLFMGLRHETGPDWFGYVNIYEVVNGDPDAIKSEKLFSYLNILSDKLGLYVYGVNFVCTLIFLSGVFSYANRTARPWLAIAAVIPYLCFIIGMSGIRQAAAIGVIFLALARWERLSTILKLAFVAVAMGFHTSAGFAVMLILFDDPRRFWTKAVLGGLLVGYMVTAGAGGADAVDMYTSRYVANNMQSTGSLQHILLSAFPGALYLKFRKKIELAGWGNSLVTIGAIGSILALPLSLISSTGVDRLALYFSYVQMWTYPALIVAFKGSETLLLAGMSAIILFVFFMYFTFGTTAFAYVPYYNVMFR